MKELLKILRRNIFLAVGLFVFLSVAVILILSYFIFYYSDDLPDYSQLENYSPPQTSRVYAKDGTLIAEFFLENRVFLPIEKIPKTVINAFLAAEDKNFYEHKGIDFMSVVRAIFQNIANFSANRNLVGGSTITQQVVKNFLLTNERTFKRKFKEAILSFRISQVYSKDRILELYLNQIYLGSGSYGVAASALTYFNKDLSELDIEEAALLAALPKSPIGYDPTKDPENAKMRRDWVIEQMYEADLISRRERDMAASKKITLNLRRNPGINDGEFFVEEVRRTLAKMYGYDTLYKGGLHVITTLDPTLQTIATKAFTEGIESFDRKKGYRGPFAFISNQENWASELAKVEIPHAAPSHFMHAMVESFAKDKIRIMFNAENEGFIDYKDITWAKTGKKPNEFLKKGDVVFVIPNPEKENHYYLRQIPLVNGGLFVEDPENGRVLGMVGGYSYNASEFNRATQAKRQPGSAFKPFVYLTALENGYTPASIIVDGPIELFQGPGLPMWRPKNYSGDFLGPLPLRKGLEKSRNTMTVRLAQSLGIDKIVETTKRFGISTNPPNNFSIVLGAAETTLDRITNAYAMFVNGGHRIHPQIIEKIQDKSGKTIFRQDTRQCDGCDIAESGALAEIIPPELVSNTETVTDSASAFQMAYILQGVVQRGTAVRAKSLGRTDIGGKTGTTNDSNDVWFIGFTPNMVIGTYLGYDAPRSLGAKETGASSALPVFISFAKEAFKDVPNMQLTVPNNIYFEGIDPHSGYASEGSFSEAFKEGTGPNAYLEPSATEITEGEVGEQTPPVQNSNITAF